MKVLHITNDLNAGGAERLIVDTLPLLNKVKDFQVDLLLLDDKKNAFTKYLSTVNYFVCTIRNFKSIRNILWLRKFIVNGKYDLVHVHLFPANYWVALANKLILKNKPVIVTTEHNTVNRRRKYKILRFLEKFIYKEFSKIICISEKTRDAITDWLKPKENTIQRFKVVENGINTQKFRSSEPLVKSELIEGYFDDMKIVCMVGNFMPQKDHPTLIKSMLKTNCNIHLILVGKGPTLENVKELVEALNLNKIVHILGQRTDVERILKTVDIVVLSSHWEGFGLVAVEGMAAGKPVVASNVDGLREVVEGAGLLFEKGNSEELAGLINKLITDKEFYKETAEQCKKRAEQYNIDRMVNETVEIYRSLMNNK